MIFSLTQQIPIQSHRVRHSSTKVRKMIFLRKSFQTEQIFLNSMFPNQTKRTVEWEMCSEKCSSFLIDWRESHVAGRKWRASGLETASSVAFKARLAPQAGFDANRSAALRRHRRRATVLRSSVRADCMYLGFQRAVALLRGLPPSWRAWQLIVGSKASLGFQKSSSSSSISSPTPPPISTGDMSDLIFVFFDPIGQALCKRTMSIVGKLGETHAERMQFYLSKADEAGDETDRQVNSSVFSEFRYLW